MSNVGQIQDVALMHNLSRFSTSMSSHAERGGESVPGCAPFGLQRTGAVPRSIQARTARHMQQPVVVRQGLQGEGGLFVTLGAASRFYLASPRKPNPAFERTCLWHAAQGLR
jgi:hypothetical protein